MDDVMEDPEVLEADEAAETPQMTVVQAMTLEAGTLLGRVLTLWIDTGEPCYAQQHIIGPAGSVLHLTVQARPVDPAMLAKAGHA